MIRIPNSNIVASLLAVTVMTAMGSLTGCEGQSPEERLMDVGEQVEDATGTVSELDARIEELEMTLDRVRQERRRVKARLRTLEERLAARATDVAIFRAAQTALLEEPALRDAAVVVNVDDSAVTLHGTVAGDAEKRRAEELVRGITGIGSVSSRIRVDDPDAGDAHQK